MQAIVDDEINDNGVEIKCEFCGTNYTVSKDDIRWVQTVVSFLGLYFYSINVTQQLMAHLKGVTYARRGDGLPYPRAS